MLKTRVWVRTRGANRFSGGRFPGHGVRRLGQVAGLFGLPALHDPPAGVGDFQRRTTDSCLARLLQLHGSRPDAATNRESFMFSRLTLSLTLMLALAPGAAAVTLTFSGDANGDASLRARAARYEPMIAAAARRHGVDPRVLWTIAYLETRFRPSLVSPANAAGLMQFIPATARRFGLGDRFDPAASVDAAARYVRFLSRQFDGRLELILAGYNAGEGAVAAFREGRSLRLPNGRVINPRGIRTGGVPPYRETQGYVRSGREVFLALARARAFDLPFTDAPAPVPAALGPDGPAATLEETLARSTYFASETTSARAVALPEDSEIAADFVVTGAVSGQRARTASIIFARE